jgi:N-acetylmuramoyl-L-alanine amidase
MGLFLDTWSPAGSGDAVGQLAARVKAQAMRWATRCCEMHLWRAGTLAAALIVLAAPTARAGDTESIGAAPQQVAACTRAASFRMIVDVGHGTQAPGALSARGVDEYVFNLRLAQKIDERLRAAGFDKTTLMVTPDKPSRGLFKRVTRANASKADLFLSVHHDSVPDKMLENWQVDGHAQHYNDRFPGHSIFISNTNADRAGSLVFARQLGLALKERGLRYTPHYTEKFMGKRQRELVDREAGVYRYDALIVLKSTLMPAVLMEAGSIVNRDEELLLATPEHEAIMANAVVAAVDQFCVARSKPDNGTVVAARKPDDATKKPHEAKKHDEAAKKPHEASRPKATSDSGTWSFLRNLKLLSSAHVRNRD